MTRSDRVFKPLLVPGGNRPLQYVKLDLSHLKKEEKNPLYSEQETLRRQS